MRALWLHYPDDSVATARGDEYLFGREILVAPVLERGARTRILCICLVERGTTSGIRSASKAAGSSIRRVDLETTPLYVRAGAVIAMGPVNSRMSPQNVTAPITLWIHPGADGASSLYEDDGESFDYRVGEFMRIHLTWSDHQRRLSARLATDSKMIGSSERKFVVHVAGESTARNLRFMAAQSKSRCDSTLNHDSHPIARICPPASVRARMPASVLRSIWHHKDV